MRPDNCYYAESHEWIREDGDEYYVGLSDYAISELQDIVFLDIFSEQTVEKEEPIGEIESVKAIADIYAPVSGKIVEINETVQNQLDVLQEDPYEDGWLVVMKQIDPGDLEELMSVSEYNQFVAEEEE